MSRAIQGMGNQHVLDGSSYEEKGDASKGTHNFQKLSQELVDSVTIMAACTVLISHGFFYYFCIHYNLYICICVLKSCTFRNSHPEIQIILLPSDMSLGHIVSALT